MTFNEFYKNISFKSDKGTKHDYIEKYYSKEFTNKKNNSLKILELGIHKGYSLVLFAEWFSNSQIFGIDIVNNKNYEIVNSYKNITCFVENAYTLNTVKKFEDNYFDYIIDDGPHTLQSQLFSVSNWFSKLKPGGKLIIEDVNNIEQVKTNFDTLNPNCQLFDFRKNKNRFDDVLLVYTKP